jgi:hypothetical protein
MPLLLTRFTIHISRPSGVAQTPCASRPRVSPCLTTLWVAVSSAYQTPVSAPPPLTSMCLPSRVSIVPQFTFSSSGG